MKYTAPALANERFGVKFFTPHEPRYYRAHHRRENVDCLWLEVKRLGHVFCYPYMINDHGRIYEYGNAQDPANIQRNEELIKRWNEVITPENLAVDWNWNRVEEDMFRSICAGFREQDGDAAALGEGEPQLGDGESDEDRD